MEQIYLFDVDGTLTPPRQRMNSRFAEFFDTFVDNQMVYLISGSDYRKIKEQVPLEILNKCCGVFGCSGAEYIEEDQMIYRKDHTFPDSLLAAIDRFVEKSPYTERCGNHVEHRPGMLNVSVVGRNATLEQRTQYHLWDQLHQERRSFVAEIENDFDGYEASCGGEISVDIVPEGWNKSVIKPVILEQHPGSRLTFFGDRMGERGNDKPLADVLNSVSGRHRAIAVESYKDTWIHLRHLMPDMPSAPLGGTMSYQQLFAGGVTVH